MDGVRVFVEAEAGSNLRYVYDEMTFEPSGSRQLAATYPFPYGFVVGTTSEDGSAVDCYLLTTEPVGAGTFVDAEPVGLLEQFEGAETDHKLLAVLAAAPRTLDPDVRNTLQRFIQKVFERSGVKVEVGRLLGADAASRYLAAHRT